MKNRIKRLFTQNIGWKIVAVLAGILTWALLSNTQDPTVSKTLNIPIQYLNEDKLLQNEKLVKISGPDTVTIITSFRQSQYRKVNESLFTCTADLVDHSGGDLSSQRVHVNVEQIGGSNIILDWNYLRNNPNITVNMDEYISKEFQVQLLPDGSLPDVMLWQNPPVFTPSSITVSGPKSKFGNLNSVKASVSMAELAAEGGGNIVKNDVPVSLYDSNGEVIRNTDGALTMSQTTVSLSATIARIQSITLNVEGYIGTPDLGFRVINVTPSVQAIDVKGLKGNLSELNQIVIPKEMINVDGISETTDYRIELADLLPEGVTTYEGNGTVTVTVEVEAFESRTFNLDTARINVRNKNSMYVYTITGRELPIKVRGFAEDLDLLNINSDIEAFIDVSGLGEGTHTVPVTITQPTGYYFDNADALSVSLNVKINESMTSTEAESNSEPESTSGQENPEPPSSSEEPGSSEDPGHSSETEPSGAPVENPEPEESQASEE